jgi:crotonobetainyl-CoA:carnitine CoA-transferase CaiB-like acyl-CoA transferase
MGMHKYRPSTQPSRLKDPLAKAIAERFGRRLVALRIATKLSRHEIVLRTGLYWGRVRDLEEGWQVPTLQDVMVFAALHGISADEMWREATTNKGKPLAAKVKRGPPCLCEQLGENGRAALRSVVGLLSPHVQRRRRRE